MRQILRITLAQIVAIHNANYSHDMKANKIIDRLSASFGYDRGAVIPYNNEIIGEYTDHIETLID